MKIKLWCRIFGHDFRKIDEDYKWRYTRPSDYCRHCGLSKEDLKEIEE